MRQAWCIVQWILHLACFLPGGEGWGVAMVGYPSYLLAATITFKMKTSHLSVSSCVLLELEVIKDQFLRARHRATNTIFERD